MRRAWTLSPIRVGSVAEFLALPEVKPPWEFDGWEAVQKSGGERAHSLVRVRLGSLLFQYVVAGDLGEAVLGCYCIFGPPERQRAYAPDISVVTRERLPKGTPREAPYYLTAPDIAVEVLSPDEPACWFASKLLFFLRNGVRLFWVIDPEAETVPFNYPPAVAGRLKA